MMFCRSIQALLPENCPFSPEEISETDIDSFNDLMASRGMTEDQVANYREIRRKIKNRVSYD